MKRVAIIVMVLLGFGCRSSPDKNSPSAAPAPASKPADEAAAIRTLGPINQAQADYFHRKRRYALSYDELVEAHILNEEPSKSAVGYQINLHPSADAELYTLVAMPTSPSANVRYFYTDKTGIIRAEQGKEATSRVYKSRKT
jgi:hypothetical protein